jgi:hypothetical protein
MPTHETFDITNVATMQNFEFISDKCNIMGICTSGNCVHKLIISYVIINILFLLASQYRLKHWRKVGIVSSSQNFGYNCTFSFEGLVAVCCCCLYISAQYPGTCRRLTEATLCIAAAVCVYCYHSAVGNVDIPFAYPHSRLESSLIYAL